ncbi:MAG: transcription termination/antitermination protein NusG [Chloroflexi bacterium RBG_19FT_COMBO_48_23]|nr:MAG: transcription termination/antitermination protein NusG [Chloroflexi bacterium RBG_19FT_COMBO_48_23]
MKNGNKRWYIVHTYSGYEDRVQRALEQRIKFMDAEDKIFKIEIPKEEEIEIRGGQRRTVSKKVFPGYVLVQMQMDDDSWNVVRNTPGITGFVGSGNKPTPLSEDEVHAILKRAEGSPQVKVGFRKGESVRVVDGPFNDFVGVVDEINVAKGKVKVMLTLFGRETSVELDFLQVQRL